MPARLTQAGLATVRQPIRRLTDRKTLSQYNTILPAQAGREPTPHVIPAQAGIHDLGLNAIVGGWTPAYAGVTAKRGGLAIPPRRIVIPAKPACSRQAQAGYLGKWRRVIPPFAGRSYPHLDCRRRASSRKKGLCSTIQPQRTAPRRTRGGERRRTANSVLTVCLTLGDKPI